MGIGIIALVVNLVAFGLLLGVEALIAKLGWIPARSSTLRYMWERDLFRIGDTVGLSIVAFAVGSVLNQAGFPPAWYVAVAIVGALILTGFMHTVWSRQNVRDSAYPPSKVSLLGILHLPYFGGHVTWVLLGLWHITNLSVLGFVLLGFVGGIVLGITLLRDGKQNKEG